MSTIKRFEDLEVWQLSRALYKQIHVILDDGLIKNNYRLINQIEGSSGSIMDNIAEGFERGSRSEFILFLGYAKGSCGELRSQLYRLLDRKLIDIKTHEELYQFSIRINIMIQKLITYLQTTNFEGIRKKTLTPNKK